MPFDVYDFRKDVRNVVILPDIRSRFLRMEPGEVGGRHSHDLGQEVFLILEGECEFEIDGERAVLGPGQMCFAAANQMHQVRTVGDQPMTMYLSVTPHIEPTHTFWDAQGEKLPPRYGGATVNERAAQPPAVTSAAELAANQIAAARALAAAAVENAANQERGAAALEQALAADDLAAARAAVDGMWRTMLETYQSVQELGNTWNAVTATVAEPHP
ncbi:MAG: cupin domain-containing protein [Thermomicrobiales bacterium]|nr:cupin domain-containing protein [Thermomicrobiales bacterium]